MVKNSFHSQSFGKGITNYNQSDFAHKGPKRITPPYKDWDAIKNMHRKFPVLRGGGIYCTWSQHAQNIFLESLEVFLKIFKKLFIPHFLKILCQWRKCRCGKKSACPVAGNTPKWLMGQKIDFFKVRDIVTPIEPRKKKHQTNVSSALKTF